MSSEYLIAYDAAITRWKTVQAWSAVLGKPAQIKFASDCPVCGGADLACSYGMTRAEKNRERESWW